MVRYHIALLTLLSPSIGGVSEEVVPPDPWMTLLEAEGRGAWNGANGTPIRFSLFALLPTKSEFSE